MSGITCNATKQRLTAGDVALGFGVHHLRTVATAALAGACGDAGDGECDQPWDRANLSIAGSAMATDLGINSLQLGAVFSAFAMAYVLAQIPAGWLLDRFDAPRIYGVSLVLWSACTVLQGFVGWMSAI